MEGINRWRVCLAARGGLAAGCHGASRLLGGCEAGLRYPAHEAEYPPAYYAHPFTVIGDQTRRDGWGGGVWPEPTGRSPVPCIAMTTDRAGTVQIPLSGTRLTVLRERKQAMARSRPQRIVLPLAALALAVLLGGCVVYPAYPAHGYPPRTMAAPMSASAAAGTTAVGDVVAGLRMTPGRLRRSRRGARRPGPRGSPVRIALTLPRRARSHPRFSRRKLYLIGGATWRDAKTDPEPFAPLFIRCCQDVAGLIMPSEPPVFELWCAWPAGVFAADGPVMNGG